MLFELSRTKVKLSDYNPRTEFFGKNEIRHAGDLFITVDLPNDCLAQFHPALKSLLYHYDQGLNADLVDQSLNGDPEYKPHIRMPDLEVPLKWTGSMTGAAVTVYHGVKSTIELELCNVDTFKLEPKQGGTVTVKFKIAAHPDEKQTGKLNTMIQTDIELSIKPPEASAQGDLASTREEGSAVRVAIGESLMNDVLDDQTGERAGDTATATDDSTTTEPLHEIRAFEDGFMIYLADTPVAGAQKFKTQQAAEKHLQKHLGVAQKAGQFERTEPAADPK